MLQPRNKYWLCQIFLSRAEPQQLRPTFYPACTPELRNMTAARLHVAISSYGQSRVESEAKPDFCHSPARDVIVRWCSLSVYVTQTRTCQCVCVRAPLYQAAAVQYPGVAYTQNFRREACLSFPNSKCRIFTQVCPLNVTFLYECTFHFFKFFHLDLI